MENVFKKLIIISMYLVLLACSTNVGAMEADAEKKDAVVAGNGTDGKKASTLVLTDFDDDKEEGHSDAKELKKVSHHAFEQACTTLASKDVKTARAYIEQAILRKRAVYTNLRHVLKDDLIEMKDLKLFLERYDSKRAIECYQYLEHVRECMFPSATLKDADLNKDFVDACLEESNDKKTPQIICTYLLSAYEEEFDAMDAEEQATADLVAGALEEFELA